MALTWYVLFDWDGDGTFGYNEANRVLSVRVERGRSGPFAEFPVGKCVLRLENNDRRFDPWYAGSPLAGKVLPQRRCRVQVAAPLEWDGGTADFEIETTTDETLAWDDGAEETLVSAFGWPVFCGQIEDVEPMGAVGRRTVTITLYDGLRTLAEATATDLALQTDVQTGAAVGAVLDAAQWPAGGEWRDLDAGDLLTYFWTSGGQTAKGILTDLVSSEQGALFVAAAGQMSFLGRTRYWTALPESNLDQEKFADLALTSPWTLVANLVHVRCAPAELAPTAAALWTLRDKGVFVPPGGSVTLQAEFTNASGTRCAARGVIAPVAVTDYTAGSLPADGWNMTAFCGVTLTAYATQATVTVTNLHTSVGLYVLTLAVRGYPLVQDGVTLTAADAASQAIYGVRVLDVNAPWRQSVQSAGDLADLLIGFYATPRPLVEVKLDNVFPDMLSLDLCDRVVLTAATYSINGTFRVGGVSLATGETMQDLQGTLNLEPADNLTYWLLGTAGYGELGVGTRLGV